MMSRIFLETCAVVCDKFESYITIPNAFLGSCFIKKVFNTSMDCCYRALSISVYIFGVLYGIVIPCNFYCRRTHFASILKYVAKICKHSHFMRSEKIKFQSRVRSPSTVILMTNARTTRGEVLKRQGQERGPAKI